MQSEWLCQNYRFSYAISTIFGVALSYYTTFWMELVGIVEMTWKMLMLKQSGLKLGPVTRAASYCVSCIAPLRVPNT